MILISLLAIAEYVLHDPKRFLTAGMCRSSPALRTPSTVFLHNATLPHVFLWLALLACALAVAHIQIITRLFAFMPVLYWYLAHVYVGAGRREWRRNAVLCYVGLYGWTNAVLFFAYYPPA